MVNKLNRDDIISYLAASEKSLSLKEIQALLPQVIAERTLRRWLADAVESGRIIKQGQKRATRYQTIAINKTPNFKFLANKSSEQQQQILKQLRDLWTHTSTALEGNTLTLGDTHFLLEEGLTISGKPIKEHQEIIGHASAIELLYQSIEQVIDVELCFELHKAIQSEIIYDIEKPNGKWKVVPNGTYTVDKNNQQIYLEYAKPQHVPLLMSELINQLNNEKNQNIQLEEAHIYYARVHAAIAHIHPFWDGNGRIARLLANVPLLKSGLPPIIIPKEKRREYIQLLASYEMAIGQLNNKTGVWPQIEKLQVFEQFCLSCYQTTLDIIN